MLLALMVAAVVSLFGGLFLIEFTRWRRVGAGLIVSTGLWALASWVVILGTPGFS